MITRIAPTPSGFLHRGNLYNFLLNWLWARARGGQVLLRIDDADAERKRKEYVEDIFFVLDKMGLDWDMGPTGPDEFEAKWSQALRRDLYEDMLRRLEESGHVYACSCSRSRIREKDTACNCRELSIPLDAESVAWKLQVDPSKPIEIQDKTLIKQHIIEFVVRKKDGWPAYAVTSLADDRYFGITHIVRGEDLLESTARQLYADSLLPDPRFHKVHFRHHPLVVDGNDVKLSKSAGARSSSLLENERPDALLKSFAEWMGWDPEKYGSLAQMIKHPYFDVGG